MMMMMILNNRTTFILNVKAEVIPIITGVSETISKSFRKYPSNMPRKQDIKQLQTTTILGTAHTFGKVLMQKYKTLSWEVTLRVSHIVTRE
jgi:hypothetical protein